MLRSVIRRVKVEKHPQSKRVHRQHGSEDEDNEFLGDTTVLLRPTGVPDSPTTDRE